MRSQKGFTRRLFVYALPIVLSSILVSAAYAVVSSHTIIGSSGAVKAIGVNVYWDAACTNTVAAIDWSALEAGASARKTVYLQNMGNAAATLFLDTDNWAPPTAAQYLTLLWDYGGQSINPGAVVTAVLTLTAASGVSGITNFSFDIIITASG